MECPVCKKDYESGDLFCRNCGAQLGEQQQPQGRFRPLFRKEEDPTIPWHNYVRPLFMAALWFCLGLLALAGAKYVIEYLLRSN